jgi:hypothetical protein
MKILYNINIINKNTLFYYLYLTLNTVFKFIRHNFQNP